MAKDVIARLKADTSQWDGPLSRAGRSVEQFKQQNLTLEGALNGGIKTLLKAGAQYASYGAAVAGAMKVAKDAFMSNESGIDTWGRAVQASEGMYNTFLQTLNNGSWSNFFANLNDAISGSIELYNALDRLGSVKANNAAAIAIEQKALADARLKLQEAKASGDKNYVAQLQKDIQAHESRLASLRGQEVSAGKKAGFVDVRNTLRTYANAQGGAPIVERDLNAVANDLIKNGQDAFDKYARNMRALEKKAADKHIETITDEYGKVISTYEESFVNINKLTAEEQEKLRIARAVTEGETALQRGIGTYGQAVSSATQSANEQFRYNRQAGLYGSGGNGNGNGKTYGLKGLEGIGALPGFALGETESMKELNAEMAKYKRMLDEAKTSVDALLAQQGIEKVQKQIEAQPLALSLGVSTESVVALTEGLKNNIDSFFEANPIELLPTDYFTNFSMPKSVSENAGMTAEAWQAAAHAIANAGSAMQNLEDPAARVTGIVAQAIANIALGFAQAVASPATGAAGVFGWIAAATMGLATMTSTIASVKAATEYHSNGGPVLGNSPFIPRGTDTVPAMLTKGEIVLNAANQRNLADNLQGKSMTGGTYESRTSGEDIVTVVNTYGRRTGRGELLFG